MSNRDLQPFQFSCPNCEEIISFTIGSSSGNLEGAIDVVKFDGPFTGETPFVDLHLDFPVSFGAYKNGSSAYMKAVSELGSEAYAHLAQRLTNLNMLHTKNKDLKRLITQYKRGDTKSFAKICSAIPGVELKSQRRQDIIAGLYAATSIMSSPFTIHELNKELSHEMPHILRDVFETHTEKTNEYLEAIADNGFLENLHHDCISLYPKIIELDLPLRPTFYYDYVSADKLGSIPTRVSASDFEMCSNLYKDLAEVYSRQLVLLAGLNNLIKRGDADLFEKSVRLNIKGRLIKDYSSLNDYANVDLGRKVEAIDDSFYLICTKAVDNKLRNSIAHYKYEYKSSSQLITFYPAKEGMRREKYYSLYFIEFMRKVLLLFREVHSINHMIKALLFFRILILKEDV
ncbi:hypothetical protein [Agaribacterium sp. ZY112]|uniref:hypothetical protein n=1 Tax=Agaribacterium sp. ZY112 TaxID=3233574 RepID=UPI003523D051